MNTNLVPSISIDAIVARRDAVAARLATMRATLREINDTLDVTFTDEGVYRRHNHFGFEERASGIRLADDDAVDQLTRYIDAKHWDTLMQKSDMWSLMDRAAREAWNKRLSDRDVPAFTIANIEATFAELHAARGDMFERGVVAVFRSLSWDYKTNTPVKFGRRLVLTHMIDVGVKWDYSSPSFSGAARLDDLVRVMSVLDGKPEPDHRQSAGAILRESGWPVRARDRNVLGMFDVRGFKNGNAHLTFLRPDLVDKMNQILAKHYPNALPPVTP